MLYEVITCVRYSCGRQPVAAVSRAQPVHLGPLDALADLGGDNHLGNVGTVHLHFLVDGALPGLKGNVAFGPL